MQPLEYFVQRDPAELLLPNKVSEQPLHRAQVKVIKDGRVVWVLERGECGEVIGVQRKVKDAEVLLHALAAHGLGDDDDVRLDERP